MRQIYAIAFALARNADVPWPSTRGEATSLLKTLNGGHREDGGN